MTLGTRRKRQYRVPIVRISASSLNGRPFDVGRGFSCVVIFRESDALKSWKFHRKPVQTFSVAEHSNTAPLCLPYLFISSSSFGLVCIIYANLCLEHVSSPAEGCIRQMTSEYAVWSRTANQHTHFNLHSPLARRMPSEGYVNERTLLLFKQ